MKTLHYMIVKISQNLLKKLLFINVDKWAMLMVKIKFWPHPAKKNVIDILKHDLQKHKDKQDSIIDWMKMVWKKEIRRR